jgi:hypothetical protein
MADQQGPQDDAGAGGRGANASAGIGDTGDLSPDQFDDAFGAGAPISPICEAAEDENGQPYVSFSVAPDAGSPYMPLWQEGLIHEVMHQLTGARDPAGPAMNTPGATEVLARRVAQEMGLRLPNLGGYGSPARNAYLNERNAGALRDAVQRHGNHAGAFFKRLGAISKGRDASPDFRELHAPAAAPASRRPASTRSVLSVHHSPTPPTHDAG